MSLTFTDKISSVMLNFTNICCLKKTAIVLTASRKFWQKCIYHIKTKLMNSELIKPDETVKIKKQWFDPYIMTKLLSKWYTCIYGKKIKAMIVISSCNKIQWLRWKMFRKMPTSKSMAYTTKVLEAQNFIQYHKTRCCFKSHSSDTVDLSRYR